MANGIDNMKNELAQEILVTLAASSIVYTPCS